MIRAIVRDPDPVLSRELIRPAQAAGGRRRVQTVLIDLVSGGTDAEKTGVARAWYWARVMQHRGDVSDPLLRSRRRDPAPPGPECPLP